MVALPPSSDLRAQDRIGMVGFCFGGGVTALRDANPELKAAVPFYGPNPALEDVPKAQQRAGNLWPSWTRALTRASRLSSAMKQNNKL